MFDIKEKYQERADEIAEEKYGKEFYDLTSDQRGEVWLAAERDVADGMADHADFLRKAHKEGNP